MHAEGDRFTVVFDGKPVLAAEDKTFADAGRVGLWTKADSVIHFDAIVIAPLDRAGKAREAAGEIRAGITFALGPIRGARRYRVSPPMSLASGTATASIAMGPVARPSRELLASPYRISNKPLSPQKRVNGFTFIQIFLQLARSRVWSAGERL